VDRLEQENVALRAENERLKSSADAVVAAAEPKKPAAAAPSAADWPSRIALKGDVRYRHQQTDDERVAAQRDEHLLRVRTSLEAKVTDTIVAGVGFSTGDGGNPRGANTRLDGEFARKSLFVDLAYIDWTFAQGAHAIGGKMKMPFFRPGQSLYWDNDVNPEGIALTYTRGTLFSIAYATGSTRTCRLRRRLRRRRTRPTRSSSAARSATVSPSATPRSSSAPRTTTSPRA
jgi:hypothetical protein